MPNRIIALLITLFLFACSKKIIPEKPELGSQSARLDTLPLSDIDIPVKISLKPFYEMAEKEVDQVYTSDGWPLDYVVEDCETRYMYKFRRGPLQLTSQGNQFSIGFMGYYQIVGSQRICTGTGSNRTAVTPWSPPCTCGVKEGERKVQVGYTVSIGFNADYTLQPHMQTLEPVPIDKCTVCFWGQDITKTVMAGLKGNMEESRMAIEDTLRSMNLRTQFQKIWDGINSVYPIYNHGYLKINPEKIRISRYHTYKDTLLLSVGISARPVITQSPPEEIKTVVPPISDFSERKGFSIYMDAMLDYDSLSGLLNRNLYKKRIDLEQVGKYVIVENCQIYGADKEKIILKLDFSGSESGTFFLTGHPEYNAEKKQILISGMEFDIKTRDLLVKSARWLFNRKILQTLQNYSRFDLARYESDILQRINEQVNREIYSGVNLTGSVHNISLMKIYTFRDKLVVRLNSSGNLGLIVNKLDMK